MVNYKKIILFSLTFIIITLFSVSIDCNENFASFGNTNITKDFINTTNSLVTNTLLSVTQDCQNASTFTNAIDAKCTPSDTVTNALIKAKSDCFAMAIQNKLNAAEQCPDTAFAACNISNITQDQVVSFKASCALNNDMINNFTNQLKQNMDKASTNTSDGFGQALNNVTQAAASALDTGNTTEKTTATNIINQVTNSLSSSVLNKIVNTFTASNTITLSGQSYVTKDILQKQTLDIVTQAFTDNKQLNTILTAADTSAKNTNTVALKGITDIIGSIAGAWWIFLIIGIVALVGGAMYLML